jgi:hypothetical protein
MDESANPLRSGQRRPCPELDGSSECGMLFKTPTSAATPLKSKFLSLTIYGSKIVKPQEYDRIKDFLKTLYGR